MQGVGLYVMAAGLGVKYGPRTPLTGCPCQSRQSMTEHQLQTTIVGFLRHHARPETLWFAVPNGQQRDAIVGKRLKDEGVRAGVADLVIATSEVRTTYFGDQYPHAVLHFLELKTAKGRQSPAQKAFQLQCELNGSSYAIARTPEEAADILYDWGALVKHPLRWNPRKEEAA